jgi:tRNA pseudouridine32 synthase/23S rRNA pseudouridine746 synthase
MTMEAAMLPCLQQSVNAMPKYTSHVPPPCARDVTYIHVDDDVLVVDKPEGLLSVPGRFMKDCVQHRIRIDHPTASVVHRLDLDTSGLMVFALHRSSLSHLAKQFRERRIGKSYVAEVFGLVTLAEGVINKPISRDWQNRPRQIIDPLHGKRALTGFQVTERDRTGNRTRLLLTPETGRPHQLRLHLASIGHPILGCDLYAHGEALNMSDRLLLHASGLVFTHPGTGEHMDFQSAPEF